VSSEELCILASWFSSPMMSHRWEESRWKWVSCIVWAIHSM